jgi:hypothetical protein
VVLAKPCVTLILDTVACTGTAKIRLKGVDKEVALAAFDRLVAHKTPNAAPLGGLDL